MVQPPMLALRVPLSEPVTTVVELSAPETTSKKAFALANGELATKAAATVIVANILFFMFLSCFLFGFTLFI
jgi:hypothetical protein